MNRITREQMFMDITEIVAKRSTCFRGNVGAVLVQNNNIESIGYNGSKSGDSHCQGKHCLLTPAGGCAISIHAEINAMDRYRSIATRSKSLDLYVSMSPCMSCAIEILKRDIIKRVFYRQEYRIRDSIEVLYTHGVEVYRLTAAGHLIDAATNELINPPEA